MNFLRRLRFRIQLKIRSWVLRFLDLEQLVRDTEQGLDDLDTLRGEVDNEPWSNLTDDLETTVEELERKLDTLGDDLEDLKGELGDTDSNLNDLGSTVNEHERRLNENEID